MVMVEKGVQIPKTKSVWEAMNGLIENPKRVRMKQAKTRLAKANSSFSQNNYSGESDKDDEDVSPELRKNYTRQIHQLEPDYNCVFKANYHV